MAKSVNKTLFFAGEHCSYKHPDTVAGAYLSGLRAAGEIAQLDKNHEYVSVASAESQEMWHERKKQFEISPFLKIAALEPIWFCVH